MTDLRAAAPALADDVDGTSLLAGLAPEQAGAVARLLEEREHLTLLHGTLADAERAGSLEAQLRVFVDALGRAGFAWAEVTLYDATLRPARAIGSHRAPDGAVRDAARELDPWRDAAALEPYRVGRSYVVDGNDGDARLLVPLQAGDGRALALLAVGAPEAGRAFTPAAVRTAELFGRQIADAVERAALATVSERRAERLQRLQAAGAALARSLDEREIVRELARQVARVVPCRGVVIARPDLERGETETLLHLLDGAERDRPAAPLGGGVIAEVARTGRAVRVDDYRADRDPLAAADDVTGGEDAGGSVLAVPMLAGIRLAGVIAVHHPARGVYSSEEEEVLATVAAQAAIAFANARLFAESERERRQSEALAEIARAVGESLRLGEVLHLILRHAMALIRAEGGSLSLLEGEYLNLVAGVGCGDRLAGMHVPLQGSISGEAVRQQTYLIDNDSASSPLAYRPTQRLANITRTIVVPLVTTRGAIGCISVFNRATEFTHDDARVLQRLADLVGVAVVNARLYGEVAEATREWAVAFDAMASGLAVLDEEGRVVRCNERAAQLAGVSAPAVLAGREFHAAVLYQAANAESPVARALAERTAARGLLHVAARGIVVDAVASPHPHGGAVVTFDDVTAHHRLAERYRRVVETANDAIVITDGARRITFANPAALRLLGGDADVVGLSVETFVPPELAEEVRAHEQRAMAGEPQRYEAELLRLDGERRVVSISTAPLREVEGVTGVVASLRDVTEQRSLASQLLQQEKLAAIGQLVSGVAHELNNPLAGVSAFAQLLLAAPTIAGEERQAVETIHHEARRAAKIVSNLLTFARRHQPERTAADVNQLLLDTLELRRYAIRMAQIELVVALDEELPLTWADPFQLQQVVLNLITNAEQALAEWDGVRRMELRTRRNGDTLVISVADSGVGIAAADLPRVFNPFHTTKPVGQGTGLGLSISDGIVREHGGRLRVESAPGHGATFYVEIPWVDPLSRMPAPGRAR
jgi:PAS domain S-box-containing protein